MNVEAVAGPSSRNTNRNANSENERGANCYLQTWFDNIIKSAKTGKYFEPIISDYTAKVMKEACNSLLEEQDTAHVLVSAVETLEKYLRTQFAKKKQVRDTQLAAMCCILLSSKNAGHRWHLTLDTVQEFMLTTWKRRYSPRTIRRLEFEIYRTINYTLPFYISVEDVGIILEHYCTTMNLQLKTNVHSLCGPLTKLFYVSRNVIFNKMKVSYEMNGYGTDELKRCFTKSIYIPCGIVLCILKVAKSRDITNASIDLEKIAKDLGQLIPLHEDHLHFVANILYKLVNTLKKDIELF